MIVVADTSVVLNLCCVRQEGLLVALFGRVLVPKEVAAEFRRLAGIEARFVGLALPTAPLLDELERSAGFWVATALRARLLHLAGESEKR